jgi:CHAT domain-containing protein
MLRMEAPWAIALIRTGRPEQALQVLRPLIQASRSLLGESLDQTAEWRGFEALALARLGRKDQALQEFAEVSGILLSREHADRNADGDTPGQIQRRAWILEGYVDLLCGLHEAGTESAAGLNVTEEALRMAEAARGGRVQRAVAASATRAAIKDPRMADRVRREQDLSTRQAALYRLLDEVVSAPPEQQSAAAIATLKRTVADLGAERSALSAGLRKAFPRFQGLVEPSPATLPAARAALAGDEALLSILVTQDQSFVWALRKTGPVAFSRSPLGEREIGPMVARLRKAVDPGQIRSGTLPAFDLASAYRLYQQLLAPAAAGWQGASTLVACVNGSLGQLPLSVLPTGPWPAPSGGQLPFASYRDVPWLARTCALYQVPSVESLVRLRGLGPGRAGRRAFLGFGDPRFSRRPLPAPAAGTGLRNLAIIPTGPASPGGPQPNPDGWTDYDRIPPLPETREEVLAIATVLAADPARDVFLGEAASKQNLLALPLDQWQIIAFSTHGLVPGEFPGLQEPALALAAPEHPGESGLLTLDEIMGLKLDADWVVLSACNTAAGDGLGAEAVSGLGRAFFYAGSRALLVTHWPVETVSARELVTSLFRHRGASPGQSRAESLRQAMLDVMARDCLDPATGKPVFAYAHPLFWAPYSLVGDGGGPGGAQHHD